MLGVLAGAGAAAGVGVVAAAGAEEVESDALGVADEVVPRESFR